MAIQKIQTLHPQPGKTNKNISLDKYNFIRENVLVVLGKKELTHPD
jgi:hypothetical protein